MQFAIVKPKERAVITVQCRDIQEAEWQAQLGGVDHGLVESGLGIVVHQYSLFVPPGEQFYFAMLGHLYGGNAVLYAYDFLGETVDLTSYPQPVWLDGRAHIEAEIEAGHLIRPEMSINGDLIWQWPGPNPNVNIHPNGGRA